MRTAVEQQHRVHAHERLENRVALASMKDGWIAGEQRLDPGWIRDEHGRPEADHAQREVVAEAALAPLHARDRPRYKPQRLGDARERRASRQPTHAIGRSVTSRHITIITINLD